MFTELTYPPDTKTHPEEQCEAALPTLETNRLETTLSNVETKSDQDETCDHTREQPSDHKLLYSGMMVQSE
jgi:hypothetical protein